MAGQSKGIIRWINHMQIDLSKALALKICQIFFDKEIPQKSFDPLNVHRILFLRFDDKIGDMVVNTSLLREIKLKYPEVQIDMVCGKNSFDMVHDNPYIHQLFLFKKGVISSLKLGRLLKKEKYDLVIDFRELTDARTIYILSQIRAPIQIGIKKENFKLYNYSLNADFRKKHVTEKIKAILKILKIENPNLKYDLNLRSQDLTLVDQALKALQPGPFIVVNPYAAARFRNITFLRLQELLETLLEVDPSKNVVLVGPPHKKAEILNFIEKFQKLRPKSQLFYFHTVQTINQLAALISKAEMVITPDTSVVHLASAFNRPTIAFYREDRQELEQNSVIWGPYCDHSQIVYASEKKEGEIDMSTFLIEDFKKSYEVIKSEARI